MEVVGPLLCSACRVVSVSGPLPRHSHAAAGDLRPAGAEVPEPGASSSSAVAADHVLAWRSARGLERDDGFAFMFLSEEDAYAEGGAAVASQAYERLMPAGVAVAEGPPVGRILEGPGGFRAMRPTGLRWNGKLHAGDEPSTWPPPRSGRPQNLVKGGAGRSPLNMWKLPLFREGRPSRGRRGSHPCSRCWRT